MSCANKSHSGTRDYNKLHFLIALSKTIKLQVCMIHSHLHIKCFKEIIIRVSNIA